MNRELKHRIKWLYAFLILMVLSSTTVYASEVDLSGLSDSKVESHNHVYRDFYNETNHWKQCDICKKIDSLSNHTLTSKWTVSSTSCSPNNYKITSCSGCSYEIQELNRNSHSLMAMYHGFDSNRILSVHSYCDKCLSIYASSGDGHVYTYGNGQTVDIDAITPGSTVYNEYGQYYTINSLFKGYEIDSDDVVVQWSLLEDKKTLNATVTIGMPDLAHQWFSTSQFTNENYVHQRLYLDNLGIGGVGLTSYAPITLRYDSNTDTLISTYSVSIRDYTKKYINNGSFYVSLYLNNGAWWSGRSGRVINVGTNFIEPTIETTGFQ